MVWCLCGGIRSNLVWVMLCQFLLSVGPVRVRTSLYKCTVQCTAVENTVQSGLQHCSHSRLGREAVRAWPGVKQFTKQQVWDSLGRQSAQKLQQWDSETRREAQWAVSTTRHTRHNQREQQQVTQVSLHVDTLQYYNIYTNAQLAKLMVYSLQKYKFQLCNCFRSRREYLHLYLVNVLILLMSSARVREHHFMSQDVIWNI